MPKGNEETATGRRQLAKERTDWALQRTAFAKERTFNAWLRTGLTAVAAGVGVARLLPLERLKVLAQSLGALLVVCGGLLFAIAAWRYRHRYQELRAEEIEIVSLPMVTFIVLLLLGTALALLLVFLP